MDEFLLSVVMLGSAAVLIFIISINDCRDTSKCCYDIVPLTVLTDSQYLSDFPTIALISHL